MALSTRSGMAESLGDQISRLVQSRTGGRIRGLNVEVINRDVVISGRASTYYLKQLATHAALDLAVQFASLTNDIAVD
jgi:hypothetical protein